MRMLRIIEPPLTNMTPKRNKNKSSNAATNRRVYEQKKDGRADNFLPDWKNLTESFFATPKDAAITYAVLLGSAGALVGKAAGSNRSERWEELRLAEIKSQLIERNPKKK